MNTKGGGSQTAESHFPKMLKKSIDKGGPAEYQYQVRDRSMTHAKKRGVALDIGANVGLWSRESVAKTSNCVLAFEPVAMFRECLEHVMLLLTTCKSKTLHWAIKHASHHDHHRRQYRTQHISILLRWAQGETQVYRLDDLEFDEVELYQNGLRRL
jgi:hypothetical protein